MADHNSIWIYDQEEEEQQSQVEEEDDLQIIEIHDLIDEEDSSVQGPANNSRAPRRSKPGNFETRTPEIEFPFVVIPVKTVHGRNLTRNKTVELYSGDFLKITQVLQNHNTSEIVLRGHLLRRNSKMGGLLPRKINEVCFIKEVDIDHSEVERVTEVPLVQFKKIRKLILTNRFFDDSNVELRCWDKNDFIIREKNGKELDHDGVKKETEKNMKEEAPLVARWRFTDYISATETKYPWRNNSLERLGNDILDPSLRIHDAVLFNEWREGGIKEEFDSQLSKEEKVVEVSPNKRKRSVSSMQDTLSNKKHSPERMNSLRSTLGDIDLNRGSFSQNPTRSSNGRLFETRKRGSVLPGEFRDKNSAPSPQGKSPEPEKRTNRALGQPLTYGDAFCGSGGTTCGAFQVGMVIKWGCDFDELACASWRKNFPGAICHQMPVFDMIEESLRSEAGKEAARVDVLHLSCPCQYYARCKVRPGPNDEMNVASLFVIEEMVKLAKPRVVTLEQTDGILVERHLKYFAKVVNMLASLNFSIRWKRVKLQEWGIPANRNRLVFIASCPGEILPQFPKVTHGPFANPRIGVKPFVTVNQALATIPRNPRQAIALDHNVNLGRYAPDKWKTPWNGNAILKNTITCDGGPSGYHPDGKRRFTVREFATLQGYPLSHKFVGTVTAKIKQIGNSVPPVAAKVLYDSIRKELDKEDGVTARPIVIDEEGGPNAARAPPVPQFRGPNCDEKEVIVLDEEEYVVVPPPEVAQFPVQAPFARRHKAPIVAHRKKASIVVIDDDEIKNSIVDVRKRVELIDITSDDENEVFYDCSEGGTNVRFFTPVGGRE